MIEELLKKGKHNRISFSDLMKLTGQKDVRKLRKQISDERKQGALILSCPEGGYYLPESLDEIERYINTMSKEARSIFAMLQPARNHLKEVRREQAQL